MMSGGLQLKWKIVNKTYLWKYWRSVSSTELGTRNVHQRRKCTRKKIVQQEKYPSSLFWKAFQIRINYFFVIGTLTSKYPWISSLTAIIKSSVPFQLYPWCPMTQIAHRLLGDADMLPLDGKSEKDKKIFKAKFYMTEEQRVSSLF